MAGLRINSEHEDECCVTIELISDLARSLQTDIESSFLNDARQLASKGARPDHLRFDRIPKNFKGAILVPELKRDCEAAFGNP